MVRYKSKKKICGINQVTWPDLLHQAHLRVSGNDTPTMLTREFRQVLNLFIGNQNGPQLTLLKAPLHYIRDLGPSIPVRARAQSKQLNCCFVFTLIRVHVRDFCLGHPCPSSSLHVTISSDTDVRVRPRLYNAHAQSRRFTWSLLQVTKNSHCLGWPRIRASEV